MSILIFGCSIDYPQSPLANSIKHTLCRSMILVAKSGLAEQHIHQFSLHFAADAAFGKDLINDGFERLASDLRHDDDLSDLRLYSISLHTSDLTVIRPLAGHDLDPASR